MHTLTELEDGLAADVHGHLRQALRLRLETAIDDLARQQRRPQSPSRFAALARQRAGCLAACEVIDTVWRRFHQGGAQFRP
ncbi:MAG: EscE/YscE/SsaE family type III secretion system needle protein co-chaperone [Burkholderiaceae bacterium]|nr:EscE/YscE/SsaE family type III secretion system needle protein co-chaperone [Burkholderiaceae bacterium]